MDAPPIQYARTDDGVNIAYWTLSKDPPIQLYRPIDSPRGRERRQVSALRASPTGYKRGPNALKR